MRKFRLTIILLVITVSLAFGQRISRVSSGVDLGTGIQGSAWSPSINYYQGLHPANARWMMFQWGLKGWGFHDGYSELTAPGNLLQSDTLYFNKVSNYGISFMIGLGFKFGNLELGVNTDLISLAFGAKRDGLYQISNFSSAPEEVVKYHNNFVSSSPSFFNVLPAGIKAQNGQSEIYVRYRISKQFGIKAGYLVGQQSYTTTVKLNNNQNRFSGTYGMPFIALAFPVFN